LCALAVAFDHQLVEVVGLEDVEWMEGEVVDDE